jgi:hypothetical protein
MNGWKDPKWLSGPPDEPEHDTRCPAHEDNEGEESQECECADLKLYDADEENDRRRDDANFPD